MIKKILKLSLIIINLSQSSQEVNNEYTLLPAPLIEPEMNINEDQNNIPSKIKKRPRKCDRTDPEVVAEDQKNSKTEYLRNYYIYMKIIETNYNPSCLTPKQRQICKERSKYFMKKAKKENNPEMLNFINDLNNMNEDPINNNTTKKTPREWALYRYHNDPEYQTYRKNYIKKYRTKNLASVKKKVQECNTNAEIYNNIINNNYDISKFSKENIQICKQYSKYFMKKAKKESNINMLNFINGIKIIRENIILIHPKNL